MDPQPLTPDDLVEPVPSGRSSLVDLTAGGADDLPAPPAVPDGPIRTVYGFSFAYDRFQLAFRWVREWRPGTNNARRTSIVFAGKRGVTVSGLGLDLDATEVDDLVAVLHQARQAAVWMIHGERPEYVLEYLDDSGIVDVV